MLTWKLEYSGASIDGNIPLNHGLQLLHGIINDDLKPESFPDGCGGLH
jgi:hypothetical protein